MAEGENKLSVERQIITCKIERTALKIMREVVCPFSDGHSPKALPRTVLSKRRNNFLSPPFAILIQRNRMPEHRRPTDITILHVGI
jgi:hypothetical protein